MIMHNKKNKLYTWLIAIIISSFLTLPAIAASKDVVMVGDIISQNSTDKSHTRFGIITLHGYVSFVVGADWSVLSMQSQPPVAVAAFQIPNPADQNTPDSTNLSVSLIQPDTKQATKALGTIGKKYGDVDPKTTSRDGWTIYSQQAPQNETMYTILDAKKEVADVIVSVRLAWPHLNNNKKDYDEEMEGVFYNILNTFEGKVGSYETKEDEVIRRPEK